MDIIEAGFPAASAGDAQAVRMIASEVGNMEESPGQIPVICGLSRCVPKDIETAWNSVKSARLPRVHVFLATSDIHM